MLAQVKLIDEMDESMWKLLQKNLTGITDQEADWLPHPNANTTRWMLGHLAWFEEWAGDAITETGRYHVDRDPTAYLDGTVAELLARFTSARIRYRERLTQISDEDLTQLRSYFGRYNVSVLELLKTHALHFAGHRFQIRYVRGTYSRAHGTTKSEFDPW